MRGCCSSSFCEKVRKFSWLLHYLLVVLFSYLIVKYISYCILTMECPRSTLCFDVGDFSYSSRSFLFLSTFYFLFFVIPNLLYMLLDRLGFEVDQKYPSRYVNTIRFVNEIIIGIAGVTLGVVAYNPNYSILLMLSVAFGSLGVIYQVTPNIEFDDNDHAQISVPKITAELCFFVTLMQISMLLLGYIEILIQKSV